MLMEMPVRERDELPTDGREPAYMELFCPHCGDGMKFDQRQCETCGEMNPRYRA